MDTVPGRRAIALSYRAVLAFLEKHVILPDISPSYYHLAGFTLSVLFLYAVDRGLEMLLILLILVADWLDGATARRFKKCSRSGYMLDMVTDRVSEGLIFSAEAGTAIGKLFYLLWLVNLILAFYSLRANKHTSLPLRCAYLLVLVFQGLT
jgi:phosphatidylglycerophosphate synthase